jgi:hypothetical protein
MDEPGHIKLGRLFWAGPLTIVVSVVAVLLIRTLAVTILNPDEKFIPLTKEGVPTFDTAFFGGCAVIGWKVLLVSFVPDIALATLHWFGGGWPEALALMTMHIAVWAICVTILPALVTPNRHLPILR